MAAALWSPVRDHSAVATEGVKDQGPRLLLTHRVAIDLNIYAAALQTFSNEFTQSILQSDITDVSSYGNLAITMINRHNLYLDVLSCRRCRPIPNPVIDRMLVWLRHMRMGKLLLFG